MNKPETRTPELPCDHYGALSLVNEYVNLERQFRYVETAIKWTISPELYLDNKKSFHLGEAGFSDERLLREVKRFVIAELRERRTKLYDLLTGPYRVPATRLQRFCDDILGPAVPTIDIAEGDSEETGTEE